MFTIRVDTKEIRQLSNLLAAAGKKAPKAFERAINRAGDSARSKMIKSLATQTGLKQKVVKKALRKKTAWAGGLGGKGSRDAYVISARGGDISLKYFKAREAVSKGGTTAAPWNRRRLYPGAFIKAGWPGKNGRRSSRVDWHGGGHVYERVGRKRLPIKKKKSGLFIAEEMVTGSSKAAFFSTVSTVLVPRLRHELLRMLPGR